MKTYQFQEGLRQNYEAYNAEDFEVWAILFERQMNQLPGLAADAFIQGVINVGFEKEVIPDFRKVNDLLKKKTGWEIIEVPGIISEQDFFPMLAKRQFPATTWLRKKSELDYLSEPDMFHDVFGHVPLSSNQLFCDFYQKLGEIGSRFINNSAAVEMLGRIYWFTVEFGLINENNSLKIYGSGILSSGGETKFSLSNTPEKIQFDTELIMNTPYRNDQIQNKYFVIESFEQLYESTDEMIKVLEKLK